MEDRNSYRINEIILPEVWKRERPAAEFVGN